MVNAFVIRCGWWWLGLAGWNVVGIWLEMGLKRVLKGFTVSLIEVLRTGQQNTH
jgi:hypothetical protein